MSFSVIIKDNEVCQAKEGLFSSLELNKYNNHYLENRIKCTISECEKCGKCMFVDNKCLHEKTKLPEGFLSIIKQKEYNEYFVYELYPKIVLIDE